MLPQSYSMEKFLTEVVAVLEQVMSYLNKVVIRNFCFSLCPEMLKNSI